MSKYQFLYSAILVGGELVGQNLIDSNRLEKMIISVVKQLDDFIITGCAEDEIGEKRLLVRTRGLINIVNAFDACISGFPAAAPIHSVLSPYVFVHILKQEGVDALVIVEILKVVGKIISQGRALDVFVAFEGVPDAIIDGQRIESILPWHMLMRILHVLTSDQTEKTLEIASASMRAIVGLLPLCDDNRPVLDAVKTPVPEDSVPIVAKTSSPIMDSEEEESSSPEDDDDEEETNVEIDESDLGLFGKKPQMSDQSEKETLSTNLSVGGSVTRKVALLKKIRYEIRGMMGDAVASMIRLASLLKLTAAITLSSPAEVNEEGILPISLEILVRLATINRAAEEVATEIPEVNTLFELSILRPVEQLGCLSKMANGALESVERHFKGEELSAFFTRQLTAATSVINKTRRDRKITLLNLAITNPAKAASLKLSKSKRKSEKKKESKKLGIKRIKGLIH